MKKSISHKPAGWPSGWAFVADILNIRYLTGFTGSSGYALIGPGGAYFLTDFRYEEQSSREVGGFEIVIIRKSLSATLKTLVGKHRIQRLWFEPSVRYALYETLRGLVNNPKPKKDFFESLRAVKDETEVSKITKAVKMAERAFKKVLPHIKPGIAEAALAARLGDSLRREGSEGNPFDIIVASGPNSALPHAKPSARRLRPGDLVIIDWGAKYAGYCSDMTRTFIIKGRDISKQKEIYSVCLEANKAGIAASAPGRKCSAVDAEARRVIESAGYGREFGHGLGHGVGLAVHEFPSLSARSRDTLKKGMVHTVEPGIYISGFGGARIEDLVHIQKEGAACLTILPKKAAVI